MDIKKITQKDSQGNTISYEFHVPPKQEIPHPGNPKGTDTVPAWLTPGEFVMNAEATRMYKPQIEAMNEQGRAVQKAQGGSIPEYKACGGKVQYKEGGGFIENLLGSLYSGLESAAGSVYDTTQEAAGSLYEAAPPKMKEYLAHLGGGELPTAYTAEDVIPDIMLMRQPAEPPKPKSSKPQTAYQKALAATSKARGWTPEEANVFDTWRKGVGQVESNNIYDRLQGDKNTGIGRGAYQFEMSSGSGASSTAAQRLQNYLPRIGMEFSELPKSDRKVLLSKDPDFSKLSPDTQDLAFLAHHAMAPQSKLNDLVTGKVSGKEAWADWHWAGNPSERDAKLKMWENNVTYKSKGGAVYLAGGSGPYGTFSSEEEAANLMPMIEALQTTTDPATQEMLASEIRQAANRYGMDRDYVANRQLLEELNSQESIDSSVPAIFSNAVAGGDAPTGDYFPSDVSAERIDSLEVPEMQGPPVVDDKQTSFAVDSSADVPQPEDIPKSPEQIRTELTGLNQRLEGTGMSVETAGNGRYNILNAQGQSVATVGDLTKADEYIRNNFEERIANTESTRIDNSATITDLESKRKLAVARGDTSLVESIDSRIEELTEEQTPAPVLGAPDKETSAAIHGYVGKVDPAIQEAVKQQNKAEAAKSVVEATQPQAEAEGLTDDEFTDAMLQDMENRARDAVTGQPDLMTRTMNFFDEWGISDLFDKKEIGKMALMYIGSRAMGYSHGGSLNFAMKNYATNVQAKQTQHAKNVQSLLKEGKYSKSSIAAYEKSKDVDDLVPAGNAYQPTGDLPQFILYNGKKMKVQKVKGSDGGYYWQNSSGQIVNTLSPSISLYDPKLDPSTSEGKAYRHESRAYATSYFKEQAKLYNTNEDGDYIVSLDPVTAGNHFVEWAKSIGLDPQSDEAMAIMGNAYRTAVEEGKAADYDITDLEPYLNAQFIREATGSQELFRTNPDEPNKRPTYVNGPDLAKLRALAEREAMRLMPNTAPQVAVKRMYEAAQAEWMKPETDRDAWNDKALEDQTGFYKFFMDKLEEHKLGRI